MVIDLRTREHKAYFAKVRRMFALVDRERKALVRYANSDRAKQAYIDRVNKNNRQITEFADGSIDMMMDMNQHYLQLLDDMTAMTREMERLRLENKCLRAWAKNQGVETKHLQIFSDEELDLNHYV